MRTAVAGGEAELLALTHRNVGAVLTRGCQEGQADRVDAGDRECPGFMRALRERRRIDEEAEKIGLLKHNCRGFRGRLRTLADLDATPVTEGPQHVASVRFNGLVREDGASQAKPFVEIWNLSKPVDGASGWLLAGVQQAEEPLALQ